MVLTVLYVEVCVEFYVDTKPIDSKSGCSALLINAEGTAVLRRRGGEVRDGCWGVGLFPMLPPKTDDPKQVVSKTCFQRSGKTRQAKTAAECCAQPDGREALGRLGISSGARWARVGSGRAGTHQASQTLDRIG